MKWGKFRYSKIKHFRDRTENGGTGGADFIQKPTQVGVFLKNVMAFDTYGKYLI
jgi:hypothetical protein